MRVVWTDCERSTNTAMQAGAETYAHGDVLSARAQTAGRGQRGNSWESEPGRNLTFSLMLRPQHIAPKDAFVLSMAVSVGITEALRGVSGLPVVLKWPNDIYVGDRKLAGILIENSFAGPHIAWSIVGIGLNVNQTEFVSDAPNPVSLATLCGREYDLDRLLQTVAEGILSSVGTYDRPGADCKALARTYRSMLWRGTGRWKWRDLVRGETVEAAIGDVALSGHLTLDTDPPRTFAFKEIAAVL